MNRDYRIDQLKRALYLILRSDFIDLQMARELAQRAIEIDEALEQSPSLQIKEQ